MTHREIFDSAVGGSGALKQIIDILAVNVDYCLIGGTAINYYVEPIYTGEVNFVISPNDKIKILKALQGAGIDFKDDDTCISIPVPKTSRLTIYINTDSRYQGFMANTHAGLLFDEFKVQLAALEDLIQGKIWSLEDSCRKVSKQFKDQADLCRIVENYPKLIKLLPIYLQEIIKTKSIS